MTEQQERRRVLWDLMRRTGRRFLDIGAEEVGPFRSRAVFGCIEGAMLWPEDSEKQKQAVHIAAAESFLEIAPSEAQVDRDLLIALRRAPGLPPFNTELKRRVDNGMIIGAVIIEMLDDPGAQLGKTISKLTDRFNKGRRALGIPPAERIEKNWWPKFRSVAHLWAASASLKAWTKHVAFPCDLVDLSEFLAAAEYIRCRAERRPLANQGERLFLIPDGVALAIDPVIYLPFPPIAICGPNLSRWSKAETVPTPK